MEKMGAISLRWIDETMRDQVLDRWNLWKASIDALQERQNSNIYKNFKLLTEKLNGEALTRRQRLSRWIVKRLSY